MSLTSKQISGVIETHKNRAINEHRPWNRYRSWYLSEYWGSQYEDLPSGAQSVSETESNVNMETNYPYSYIDTMIANICPTNPRISISARRSDLKESAIYREALVNDVFRRADLHALLWKISTNSSICGRAFMKSVWSFRKNTVDFIPVDPRYIFFDMSANKWEDIRYLIEVTVLTKQEFETRTKKRGKKKALYKLPPKKKMSFSSYPSWLRNDAQGSSLMSDASKEVYEWVVVYEFYDFHGDGKYYHFLEGEEEPIFEGDLPYKYIQNPFSILSFNDNMSDLGGLSDIKLIASMQERLNELDTLELWHAQCSIPVMLVNSALVDNPEAIMNALQNATEPGSMVQVQGAANAPLRDLIGHTPTPSLQPSFSKMRERATQVIEFVLGIPQYSRGVVGVTDVATEVALADTATRTRNGRRIKRVEDLVRTLAEATIALYEEFLPADSDLPLRLTDSPEVLEANRESMRMRDINVGRGSSIMDYDFESVPYSPTENNRLVQLRNLNQYLPILAEAPNVDSKKLVLKLLDLLMMKDLAQEAPIQEEPPPQEMMPQMGPEPSQDTLMTGALPPGVEEPVTPALPGGGPGAPAPPIIPGLPPPLGAPGGTQGGVLPILKG